MTACPAFLISAPASGQGKTSVTAAIARAARRRGLRVRVFKTGPDYLDPMVLERASGHTVYQLDLFMGGEAHCRELLARAAESADLILVEGVMGLFDGKPSSADLAATFGLPVLAPSTCRVARGSIRQQSSRPTKSFALRRRRPHPPHGGRAPPPGGLALGHPLTGKRLAIATDACFSFIYPANLDLLRELGAEVRLFSPIAGDDLPECDALWLPGGYPELHAEVLREHPRFFGALRSHQEAAKPLLAECGGMLVLLDELSDAEGGAQAMAGLMPGRGSMQKRLAALGLQTIVWPEGELRGHTFHYSTMETPLSPIATATNPNAGRAAERLYAFGSLRASYVHHYFPSNPGAIAAFFGGADASSSH